MKRKIVLKLLLLFVFVGVSLTSDAQKVKVKFGKVSKKELGNKVCQIDSSAHAEVLYDKAYSSLDYQEGHFSLIIKRHRRIKIYDKKGYKYANIEIPYYDKKEKVTGIKAFTYNLVNNKVIKSKVKSGGILIEDVTDKYKKKKITFPDIKEGSIIEIRYTETVPLRYNYETWYFQKEIPVRYSEFVARIPCVFNFKEYMYGYENVSRDCKSSRSSGTDDNIYTYIAKDVPAFPSEVFVDCKDNYITKIEFELQSVKDSNGIFVNLTSDWDKLCSDLVKDQYFGCAFKSRNFLKKKLSEIVKGDFDGISKAIVIYNYVRDNYMCDGNYNISSNKGLRQIINDKKANSAGINLLLIALLREAGFECNPVILSTRSHGMIRPGAPNISKYNHTIAYLQWDNNNRAVYLDASDKNASFNLLPCEDEGSVVLVKDNRHQCSHLNNNTVSRKYVSINANIDDEGVIAGSQVYQMSNYYALGYRKRFDTKDKRIETLQGELDDFVIDSLSVSNLHKRIKPVKESYTFHIGEDNDTPDMLYIPALLHYSSISNPFKLKERKFPIDFPFKINEMITINYTIPNNYTVQQVPKSISAVIPDKSLSFKYYCTVVGNKISIKTSCKRSKRKFPQQEYASVKNIYDLMVKKFAEQIVLKLKE